MIYLAKGCWPVLKELKLGGNSFGVAGVGCLLAARWPHLHTLSLPETTVCSTTCDVLNFNTSALENLLTAQEYSSTAMMTRLCEAGRVQVWPQLEAVEFYSSWL